MQLIEGFDQAELYNVATNFECIEQMQQFSIGGVWCLL
jgi:hypothetical protein